MIAKKSRSGAARIGLALLVVAYGGPFLYLVATSLKDGTEILRSPAGLVFKPSLETYHAVLGAALLRSVANSAIIAFGVTALLLVLGVPAAYWLSRSRGLLVVIGLGSLILLQLVPQAATVIPLFKILAQLGLLGNLPSVILADTALLLPFAVILLRPFFVAVPQMLEEAASVDGASRLRVFAGISLPLARNGILAVGTLIWIIAWGEFLYAVTFLSDSRQLPISGVLAQQVSNLDLVWNRLLTVAFLATLPVLIVFLAMERYLREGLSLGEGK